MGSARSSDGILGGGVESRDTNLQPPIVPSSSRNCCLGGQSENAAGERQLFVGTLVN